MAFKIVINTQTGRPCHVCKGTGRCPRCKGEMEVSSGIFGRKPCPSCKPSLHPGECPECLIGNRPGYEWVLNTGNY